jgi:hypothetical protein
MPTVSQLETTQAAGSPDGSGVRRLTGDLPPVTPPRLVGGRAADCVQRRIATLSDIYLINLDGSGLTKITSDAHSDFYPTLGRQTALDWPSAPTETATGTSV